MGTAHRIRLRGGPFPCRIGVAAGETERAQPVSFEIRLAVDLESAARTDRLADTVDYGVIFAEARRRVLCSRFGLLEALAGDLAGLLDADERIEWIGVLLTKHRPPLGEGAGPVSVWLERRRAEGRP